MTLRRRHRLWVRLVMAACAAALFVLGYQWGNHYQRPDSAPAHISGVRLQGAHPLPPIALREGEQPFERARLDQGWTLLMLADLARDSGFGALRRLIEIHNRLADQPALQQRLALVLIASGETSAPLRQAAGLTPTLHLLDGQPAAIDALRLALGIAPGRASTDLYCIAPGGRLVALFPDSEPGASVADDLRRLMADATHQNPAETP